MIFAFLFCMFLCSYTYSMVEEGEWLTLFRDYYEILRETRGTRALYTQYCAHIANKIPALHDSRISDIPIKECNERLIDINTKKHPRVYMMPNPSYPMEGPTYNSGSAYNSIMRASVEVSLYNMIIHLDRLAESFNYQKKQMHIHIFKAFCQEKIGAHVCNEIYHKKSPSITNTRSGSVSSEFLNIHQSGAAIDIRLWDALNQTYLDMGRDFNKWCEDKKTCMTFSNSITLAQKKNRLYCLIAAASAGLTNHPTEYYHFSRDQTASYWRENNSEKRKSLYGPISFDYRPIEPDVLKAISILSTMHKAQEKK